MGSPIIWNLILFYSIFSLAAAAAQPDFLDYACIDPSATYASNSTYGENVNTLLSDITSNTRIHYGFYKFSSGQGSNQVHGIGLCRGHLSLSTCHSCLNDSSYKLREKCPFAMEAIVWYDLCMLRYSNRSIFGVMEDKPRFYSLDDQDVFPPSQFSTTLGPLLSLLAVKASAGDSELKYATDSIDITDSDRVHALAQCTPDLSQIDCYHCINTSIYAFVDGTTSLFGGNLSQGGQFFNPSCILRFGKYPFFNKGEDITTAPSSPNTSYTTTTTGKGSKEKRSNTTKVATIIALLVTTVIFIAAIVVLLILRCLRRRRTKEILRQDERTKEILKKDENEDDIGRVEALEYNLSTIRTATGNFSDAKKLGRGGFGSVYQGTLSNGQEIAVKRLAKNSGQGEVEFKNEVLLVAKLQHRNLVKFLGFCLEEEEKLLIYELVKNRSLDYFLFNAERRGLLDWEKRYKIIDGVARGMVYLHEDSRLRIIHRDLKASNILLDSNMSAKIADFGMARLFHADQIHANTSRIVGTYGYMAPEYALYGFFSVKSDVYSFGVLVLEIICGQRSNGFCTGENVENLITWVWRNWKEETILSVVDPTILVASRSEIMRCIHIGLLCVQESVADRPTMSSVILMLGSQSLSLPRPSEPAFISYFQDRSLVELRSNLTQQTEIEVSMTEEFGPR